MFGNSAANGWGFSAAPAVTPAPQAEKFQTITADDPKSKSLEELRWGDYQVADRLPSTPLLVVLDAF